MSTALINVMSAAAIKAGKGLLRDFSEVDHLQVSRKGTANFVTVADTRTEKLLVAELKKVRPTYGFLLEEGGEIKGKDDKFRWIIDPLDGTSNFIHAIPYFCISIGLEERKADGSAEIVAGVIFDPIHNELFAAEKGKGAFLNGRKITVSSRNTIMDSLLVTGNPGSAPMQNGKSFELLSHVIEQGAILRYFGATALDLAYVACGRYDACWYYVAQAWDIAAGILLVQEAGGTVTTLEGKAITPECKALVATNKHIHAPVQKLFTTFA